jgi:tRNA threonylcarbamoyladenosine biosynthesis protein TsaE
VIVQVETSEAMESLGERAGALALAGDVIVLTGDLGAGKTTFARGFGRGMGVESPVSSPTFIVARTHPVRDSAGGPLVHIDAYRIQSPGEMDELDIDVAHSVIVAEWAAPYVSTLTDSWLEIVFVRPTTSQLEDVEADEPRTLTFRTAGPQSARYQKFLDLAGAES